MTTSRVTYKGNLRTENIHLKSGSKFLTDAPIDNNGKGEAFSPTDTVATALANCMFTIMGIKAIELKIDLVNSYAEVTKSMQEKPRRISKIEVVFNLPENVGDKSQKILENAANTCPVLHSIHPDIEKVITFNWG